MGLKFLCLTFTFVGAFLSHGRASGEIIKEGQRMLGAQSGLEASTPAEFQQLVRIFSEDGEEVAPPMYKNEMGKEEGNSLTETFNTIMESGSEEMSSERSAFSTAVQPTYTALDASEIMGQAMKLIRLDDHLSFLAGQMRLYDSERMENANVSAEHEAKFDILMEEMRSLGVGMSQSAARIGETQRRLESELTKLNSRLDSAIEIFVRAATLVESKEGNAKRDTQALSSDLQELKREVGDVGQVSVQALLALQKTEENILYAMRQEGRKGEGGRAEIGPECSKQRIKRRNPRNPFVSHPQLIDCLGGALRNDYCSDVEAPSAPQIRRNIGHSGHITPAINLHTIQILNKSLDVICDFDPNGGGGWLVFQKRVASAPGDFFRTWDDYVVGFGSPSSSFWIGLDVLAELTKDGNSELLVELEDFEGRKAFGKYSYFRISNSSENYKLHVADFSGTSGDSLAYHNGMPFSTKDRDNDLEKTLNCAHKYTGAWWYKSCHQSNLNGDYGDGQTGRRDTYATGLNWYSWKGYYYSLKSTIMKTRKRAVA